MPALKLPKLIRRRPGAPSLKQRAAALKAGLSRLIHRPTVSIDADHGRRSVMVASVAAAVPLPALIYLPPPTDLAPGPHPDHLLLEAERNLAAAIEADGIAKQAARQAWCLLERVLRDCPAALIMSDWDWALMQTFGAKGLLKPFGDVHSVPDWRLEEDDPRWQRAWTGHTLRTFIKHAVAILGQGGQTPHHIKRWRELLPAADAFDAAVAVAHASSNYRRLREEAHASSAVVSDLRFAMSRMVATTTDGLAVHVRRLAASDWHERQTEYTFLLLSAAALTGTDLRRPYFDVPEWIAAWENLGGRIEVMKKKYGRPEWCFSYPSFSGANQDFKDQVRGLAEQRQANSSAIADWLDANRCTTHAPPKA